MKKIIICNKCKGDGYITDSGRFVVGTVGTFGILTVLDSLFSDGDGDGVYQKECHSCKGTGVIKLPRKTQ